MSRCEYDGCRYPGLHELSECGSPGADEVAQALKERDQMNMPIVPEGELREMDVVTKQGFLMDLNATIRRQAKEITRLKEAAHAHEECISEIQAGQLTVAERENELHDEKDRKLKEQAEEIARLRAEVERWKERAYGD